MNETVYILREKAGFTLFVRDGRMDVAGDTLSEMDALGLFSNHYALSSPELVPADQIGQDALFEGIEVIGVKRGEDFTTIPVESIFSDAVEVMEKEADAQQQVSGYFPILSPQGAWARESFRRFFLAQLKATPAPPARFVFPEFSYVNPLHTSAARIGGHGERLWGVIQDRENLNQIQERIQATLRRLVGTEPFLLFTTNHYLKISYAAGT